MPCDVAAASPAGDALAPALLRSPVSALRLSGAMALNRPTPLAMAFFVALSVAGAAFPSRPGHAQAPAGAPAVCPVPGEAVPPGHRIRCVREDGAGGDVEIDAAAVTIDAGGEGPGIEGRHRGGGDVRISVRDSRVTTAGRVTETNTAHGIDAFARTGSVEVRLRDVEIEILGTGADDPADPDATAFAAGVAAARSEGSGRVAVVVAGGRIATRGRASRGIAVGGAGNVAIHIRGATVATPSPGSRRTSPRAEKRRSGARPVAALICSLGEGRICCVEAARWNQYGATLTSVTRNGP